MTIPVVCFECGSNLANKYLDFKEELAKKYEKKVQDKHYAISDKDFQDNRDICEKLGIENYCCRMHMISAVNTEAIL